MVFLLLKFAIQDFIEDRQFNNLSPTTIDGYLRTLKEFKYFCEDREIIEAKDVTPSTIKSYLVYCQKERGNNSTSVNHKLKNLRVFFNYLVNIGEIEERKNPFKKITCPKEDIKIEVFTDEQVNKMLRYYARMKHRDKSFYAYRDYTIIVTLLSTGMRLGELCNLRWKDIDFINETITVYGKKREFSSIPMFEKLKKELSEYRVFVERCFEQPNEYVFTTRDNKPLSPNAVKNMFKRLKTIMNFKDTRVSAHTFRHYVGAKMVRKGCDVFTIQKILRHKDLKMTMRYVNFFGTALKEQNNKYNPLNDFDLY